MVRWEGGGEEGGKKAGVVVASGARVRVKGGSPSPCPCANSWCSATPRAISRSPAPRTRDRTVRARSRGVPRPHAVCRALRDDASSESRALVCSAVSGVRRFWQQVKSLACFFWSKRWCLGKDDADGRPRRLREDAPSSDVWCAMEIAIGRPWRWRARWTARYVFSGRRYSRTFSGLASPGLSRTTRAPGTMTPKPFSRAAQAALAPVLLLLCIAGCLAQQQPPSTAGLVSLAALYSALPTAKSRSSQHQLPRHSAVSHLPPLTSPLAVGRVPGPEPGAGRPRDHRREERDLRHLQTHFDRAV